MIPVVYVEEGVREHPRTKTVLARLPRATVVPVERYGEVFNPRAQSFRLQKRRPSLVLARKHEHLVLEAPAGYGIGGSRNYYFSHLLNCPYDCRYCFLQGMYRSAHYVLFVNYDDFAEEIRCLARATHEPAWFFSGYDCDSLAFEGFSGFAREFVALFATTPNAFLELRTKSVAIGSLLAREPTPQVVVAFSLTPDRVARALEHGAPSVERRLRAARRLQDAGWQIGFRFDPLIDHEGFEQSYADLFARVFSHVDADRVHSVSLGAFRLPPPFFRRMRRLYPDEPLLALTYEERDGIVSYPAARGNVLFDRCRDLLLRHVRPESYFPCLS